MKAGWKVRPLGEVCEIYQPKTISAKEMTPEGKYIVYGANGPIGRYSQYNHEEGQLLITCRGATCGSVNRSEPFSWITGNAMVVRPRSTSLMSKFVEYLFRGMVDLSGVITGAAQPQITRKSLVPVRIPVPPLDEQTRIVSVLDEAFEGLARARANAEANLADARELTLNHLRTLFSDCERLHPLRPVGEIGDHCLGKMLDKNKNQGALRPYLRNINVRWFQVETSDMLEMRIEDREVERYSAQKGDLLICEGGYPGRAAVWDQDDPVFFQKALHRVRFSNPTYATFLMHYLFLKDATGQLKEHFTGSGIQHFTGQALAKFRMPFPDLKTTVKLVGKIEEMRAATDVLERQYEAAISQLENLRQSLLQKAFSGELT